MEYIEVRGKTIEIAIALGLEELQLRDVSEARVEVLQQAERGFLGMGGRDAVVRLTRKEETEARGRRRGGRGRGQESGSAPTRGAADARSSTSASGGGARGGRGGGGAGGEGRPGQRTQSGTGGRSPAGGGRTGNRPPAQPRQQVRAEVAPHAEAPQGAAATDADDVVRDARPPRANGDGGEGRPRRRRGGRGRGGAGGGGERGPGRPSRHEEGDDGPPHSAEYGEGLEEKAEVAHEFVTGLLTAFDIEATVNASGNDDAAAVEITVEGEQGRLQVLVGRQGSVLQAIQDLTRTVVQRRMQSATRIRLDVGGYRERRKVKLESFAQEQAQLALESGREIELDPMSSPDRKVVHDAISLIDGVQTYSEGEEPDRYVVLAPTGPPRPATGAPEAGGADEAAAESAEAEADDTAEATAPEADEAEHEPDDED